jgi:hypothetical protein
MNDRIAGEKMKSMFLPLRPLSLCSENADGLAAEFAEKLRKAKKI